MPARGATRATKSPARRRARCREGLPRMSGRSFERSMAWLARAKQVVPGTSQTLSKGPGMFVEGAYPVFLERGRGSHVWDVDGNEYVDYIHGSRVDHARLRVSRDHRGGGAPARARQHLLPAASARGGGFRARSPRSSRAPRWCASSRRARTPMPQRCASRAPPRAATSSCIAAITAGRTWYAITTPRSKGIPKDARPARRTVRVQRSRVARARAGRASRARWRR